MANTIECKAVPLKGLMLIQRYLENQPYSEVKGFIDLLENSIPVTLNVEQNGSNQIKDVVKKAEKKKEK